MSRERGASVGKTRRERGRNDKTSRRVSYLSFVSPPQAVAGLGRGDGDYRGGAGHAVTPRLAQEGP